MFTCVSEFGAVIDVRVNRRGPSRDLPVIFFYFLHLQLHTKCNSLLKVNFLTEGS